MNKAPIFLSALFLGTFAVTGVALVAVTHQMMDARISENVRLAMKRKLAAIIPEGQSDNDPLSDFIEVSAPDQLGAESTRVYRVRNADAPVAVILNPVVPDGYAGPIQLLVSVLRDGSIGGVRVLSHRETPGLGDQIEESKSDWVMAFDGKSIGAPPESKWGVKRDGGQFDQFTGATITPRAIVAAVKRTLLYVRSQGEWLYAEPSIQGAPATKETG